MLRHCYTTALQLKEHLQVEHANLTGPRQRGAKQERRKYSHNVLTADREREKKEQKKSESASPPTAGEVLSKKATSASALNSEQVRLPAIRHQSPGQGPSKETSCLNGRRGGSSLDDGWGDHTIPILAVGWRAGRQRGPHLRSIYFSLKDLWPEKHTQFVAQ